LKDVKYFLVVFRLQSTLFGIHAEGAIALPFLVNGKLQIRSTTASDQVSSILLLLMLGKNNLEFVCG
jgi:hypothetical protein